MGRCVLRGDKAGDCACVYGEDDRDIADKHHEPHIRGALVSARFGGRVGEDVFVGLLAGFFEVVGSERFVSGYVLPAAVFKECNVVQIVFFALEQAEIDADCRVFRERFLECVGE